MGNSIGSLDVVNFIDLLVKSITKFILIKLISIRSPKTIGKFIQCNIA
jgi:hypothetical protein